MVEVSGVAPLSIGETTPASPSAAAVLQFVNYSSLQPDEQLTTPLNFPNQPRVKLFR